MASKLYAVIDTNVIVSAMFTHNPESPTKYPGKKDAGGNVFPDPKDIVFYEVALSKEGSFLVTGNIKHFPKDPIVVTPAEFLDIFKNL
ncbi:MAG: PIN domain-containing protein [Bacteroidaceae bacterium]|nr:PIN domain-containing protein [Bacteroidaceae bacterium]